MAGKKKKTTDGVVSKTARSSAGKKVAEGGFKPSGELSRIVPLAGGEYAYLRDPRNGKLLHLKVGSGSWVQLIQDLQETEHGAGIQLELETLGLS